MSSHRITGLDDEQLEELATRLETRIEWDRGMGRPRKLTLRQALRAILLYERQNMTQEVIGWIYSVSQSYISTMTKFLEPHIEAVLEEFVPDPAETLAGRVSCIDGALLPCWSYLGHPELYSGKHKTTGHVVQFATNLAGKVWAISDLYPGSWHDSHAYAETGWADHVGDDGGIGDKAYVGTGLVTPKKKPQGGELSPGDKDCNKEINGLRSAVERGIAHVKTWRIFHTDYRRPLRTFAQAFRTTGLSTPSAPLSNNPPRTPTRKGVPGKSGGLLREGVPVSEKYELIDAEKATRTATGEKKYTVVAMCEWLGVSTSGYYEWRDRPDSPTTRRRQFLALLVEKAFEESDETYGHRHVHAQLTRWGQHCTRGAHQRPPLRTRLGATHPPPLADHAVRSPVSSLP